MGTFSGLDRQHITHGGVEFLLEHAAQTGTFHLVVQLGVERVHIDRQAAFAPQVVPRILIRRLNVLVGNAKAFAQRMGEQLRVRAVVVSGLALVGKQRWVGPDRLLVGTPVNIERPAWQLLAWIPLALAKVQKASLAVFVAQLVHQRGRKTAFGGA